MSDLYIMFDEAYDAPNFKECVSKLENIASHYKIPLIDVIDQYNDYIDSDQFYFERGL